MGKKIFVLIVVLMSISLIGIIAVQLYWINNTIESKNIQFREDVKKALLLQLVGGVTIGELAITFLNIFPSAPILATFVASTPSVSAGS